MVKITPSIGIEDHKYRDLDPSSLKFLRSLSYHKLPHLLQLSVLKLDGSCFDVNVPRNATIAELKQAVEDVFSLVPKDEYDKEGKISWSHVWGHFCLCYEGRKLINDKVNIRSFGINDGDQLKFRHNLSIDYRPVKQRTKNIGVASRRCPMLSLGANAHEQGQWTNANDNCIIDNQKNFNSCHFEDEEDVLVPKFKLAHFLNSRLSYTKLKR